MDPKNEELLYLAKGQYMKSIVVTTTMGPGIKINPAKA